MREVLIDVCGVLADLTGHVFRTLGSMTVPADITRWDFVSFMEPEFREQARDLLKVASFWRELPTIEGAAQGIEAIRAADLHVIFCTSPYESCQGWEGARRAWLKEHFAAENHDIIFAAKKRLVRGRAILDDKPKTIADWGEVNGKDVSVLFDAPYNRELDWPTRMRGWADVDLFIQAANTHAVSPR